MKRISFAGIIVLTVILSLVASCTSKNTSPTSSNTYNTPATTSQPKPPAAPTNLTVSKAAYNQIIITWADNAGDESAYRVERASDSGFTIGLWIFNQTANSVNFTDSGISIGKNYYYRVLATNSIGNSSYSNVVSILVPAPTVIIKETPLASLGADWDGKNLKISPDNRHIAYIGRSSSYYHVVYDGKVGTTYSAINTLTFSPDSKHLAYIAQVDNNNW